MKAHRKILKAVFFMSILHLKRHVKWLVSRLISLLDGAGCRNVFACLIIWSSDSLLTTLVESLLFRMFIRPENQAIKLLPRDEKHRKKYLAALQSGDEAFLKRSFFACMLYCRPHEIPVQICGRILARMEERQRLAAYGYLFNVYFPYRIEHEAGAHLTWLTSMLVGLKEDIEQSNNAEAAEKIEAFTLAYSGSVSLAGDVNMKDFLIVERQLLKKKLDYEYPKLKNRPFAPSPREHNARCRIVLIRNNFRGEIHFFSPILKYLNREKYDLHLVVFGIEGMDEFKEEYPDLSLHHLDGADIEKAVEYLRGMKIDILVNSTSLTGKFNGVIASILCYRVARFQLMSCADVTTSGLPEIDYFLIGENYTKEDLSGEFLEEIMALPGIGFYMPVPPRQECNQRHDYRSALGISPEQIVYVSNAQMFKLTPELLTIWLGILKSVPNSKLLLIPYNTELVKLRFEKSFSKIIDRLCHDMGVDRNGVIIENSTGRDEVMKRLGAADIYLDTFPYNGATSTSEALSLGLPVVSMKDRYYRGKLTSGMLEVLDMREAIVSSAKAYTDYSVALGVAAHTQASRHKKPPENFNHAPFFDAAGIARDFDVLFTKIMSKTVY